MKFRNWLVNQQVEDMLVEAQFGTGRMAKAADALAAYLSKHFGALYPYGGKSNYSESYTKSNGNSGVGFRFISDDGKAVRIDFDASAHGELSGVTVWTKLNHDPAYYINIPSSLNSIEAAKHIVSSIVATGSAAQIKNLTEGNLSEAGSGKLDTSNLDPSLFSANGTLKRGAWDLWKKYGVDLEGKTWDDLKQITKQVNTQTAGAEITSRDKEERKAVEALSKKKYADPDTIFPDLIDLVNMVIKGGQPSLLVTGMAGVGKTFTITTTIKQSLGSEGKQWTIVKGKTTAMGLYSALFINRDKLIVFDDSDSVFANLDSVNILKAALDSYDTRMVSWITKATQDVSQFNDDELAEYEAKVMAAIKEGDTKVKLPNKFEFKGKIIFISNLPESKIDDAVKSRSFVIDVTLSREALLKRIESLLPTLDAGTPMDLKLEAFEALKEFSGPQTITMRSVVRAIRIRQSGSPRWKELIKNYV